MTEGIMSQKVTPLLKCFVLFLFIFTAKVLTSRPNESHDTRNGIHHVKPSFYVRTFTKYHHRRTIQWNNPEHYWPLAQDNLKLIEKRNLDSNFEDVLEWPSRHIKKRSIVKKQDWLETKNKRSVSDDSKESVPDSNRFTSSVNENFSFEKKAINMGKDEHSSKNGLSNDVKKYKVKAAIVVTDPPTTMGPTISCLYKIHSVAKSVTPSYTEDGNDQFMVESDSFDTGPITETMTPSGPAQIEKCTDTRASCYTLWHQDDMGNITILGQGCWRSSVSQTDGRSSCDKCTRVTARLPGTKFCCCTKTLCNDDFLSLKEETITIKAESTMEATPAPNPYSNLMAAAILACAALLLMAALLHKFYCKKQDNNTELSSGIDAEKGEVMGSGPEALATGLLCVDNLSLIEHIGQGKFGSVWRGTLGSAPVAVKLYSHGNAWQKEAAIYALPHLSHPNILRYYGSDCRAPLTGGTMSHLVVLELCERSLREHLTHHTLSWLEFAQFAHGLASALAHLHTPSGNKPCIVHRDVNSNNVLVIGNTCKLADFGLAQQLLPRQPNSNATRITEAGTVRYLSPEALEGALDLAGCGAALQAVDVFALGLVLWELLSRTRPAYVTVQPYRPPYHHLAHPTHQQMQNLVSRNKARPPLPRGPVPDMRILKIAADTCDECWDHDAEARLTAVCVEERMNELKQMVSAQPPHIHDNKLQPHSQGSSSVPSQEPDKNSNCSSSQQCASTPLLPHHGRNACIERNTHTQNTHNTLTLIHKSLKDITTTEPVINVEQNCLSVARVSHNRPVFSENSLSRISVVRSYQRPLEYVQNDVSSTDSERAPKQTNLFQDKEKSNRWGIRKFFEKFNKKHETEVKLMPENSTRTSIISDKPMNVNFDRPSNLVLNEDRNFYEAPCLSPPNKTLCPTMMEERVFKELPSRENDPKTPNQIFAVIVPKAKPVELEMRSKSKGSSESINKSVRNSMSSQSMFKSNSESEDSTVKKRLSSDNKIITNSASSSRASINLELQYIDNPETYNGQVSPFDLNSDCSSSEDEHLMLLSENGGSKITMQTIPKIEKNEVLKESTQTKSDFTFNKLNKYSNFDNEYSDPNDKENLVNGYSGDNPVYLAALNGEIDTTELKIYEDRSPKSPKPSLKSLSIKRQHSLEQVSELFSSACEVNLQNPAGRVKTPGDLPVAVRRARRDRALQKGRASESNRLSLYDDRMMFGNSL